VRQTVAFAPNEVLQHVDIGIVDDNEWEPDEVFFVKLSLDVDDDTAETAVLGRRRCPAVLGKRAIQEITILNDDCEYRGTRHPQIMAVSGMRRGILLP